MYTTCLAYLYHQSYIIYKCIIYTHAYIYIYIYIYMCVYFNMLMQEESETWMFSVHKQI